MDNYGEHISGLAPCEGARWPRFTSLWWRNLMSLEVGEGPNWFTIRVRRKIGNGMNTTFWKDRWLAEAPLMSLFPRLFSISTQKEAKVGDMVSLLDGVCVWNITWRRNMFLWEINIIDNLFALLKGVVLGSDDDRLVCIPDEGGNFFRKIYLFSFGSDHSFGGGFVYFRGGGFFVTLEEPGSVQSGGVLVVFTS